MTLLLFLAACSAGGAGAALRFLVDSAVRERSARSARARGSGCSADRAFPVGTVTVNLTGSLALGVVAGMAAGPLGPEWQVVLGGGLLGGYTTFSTASFETVRLVQQRRWSAALVNGVGVVAAGALLAWLGYAAAMAW